MARLYSGILLCAAGVLGASQAFLLPPQTPGPISSHHAVRQVQAQVRHLPGRELPFVRAGICAGAVSSPFDGGVMVRDKSQVLKQQFERAFAEAVRAPQALGDAGLTRVLEMAADGRMWSRALQLLRLPGVEPKAEHFLLALKACKRADGKWRAALEVLDLMEAAGLQSVAGYNEAMAVCRAAQRPKEVVQILDRMAKAGVSAGLSSYNLAMASLAKERQWRKAVKIVEYMEKQAVWPDVETYTGAITACGGSGEWQRALILLEDMVKKGVAPGVETYNAAVEACVVGGEQDRALAFLDEMVRKSLPLDGRSFAIGLAACDVAGGKRIEKAVELWSVVMPGAGVLPGPDTWRSLVKALARKRLWGKALELLDQARMGSVGGEGQLLTRGAALKILGEEMERMGVSWSEEEGSELGPLLVSELLAEGRSRDALQLIKAGALAAVSQPSVEAEALQLLAQFQRQVASLEQARRVASPQQQPVVVPVVSAEELGSGPEVQRVRELCESGRVEEAVAVLWSEAAGGKQPVRPSLVKLVMEYVATTRQPGLAKRVLSLPGLAPARTTCHRALRVFASAGAWGEASALMKEMEEERQMAADAGTFLELMLGARQHGSLTRVQRYARKMGDAGLALGAAHVACLMGAALDFNKPALALALLREQQQQQGAAGDDQACLTLGLRAAALAGLPEDALELQARLVESSSSSIDEEELVSGLVLEALARGGRAEEVSAQLDSADKRAAVGPISLNALLLALKELGRPGGEVMSLLSEMQAGGKADGRSLSLAVQALAASPATLSQAVDLLPAATQADGSLLEVVALSLAKAAGRSLEALDVLGRMVAPQAEEALAVTAPSDTVLLAVYRALDSGRQPEALGRLRALVAQASSATV